MIQITKKRHRELLFLAFHDDMTKLYNRQFLFRELNISDYTYMYFIDINGLKKVNQSGGHFSGDEHMRKIIRKIKTFNIVILH